MALSVGTRLGPYEISGPIGAGGMGEVYRAKDTRLQRTASANDASLTQVAIRLEDAALVFSRHSPRSSA